MRSLVFLAFLLLPVLTTAGTVVSTSTYSFNNISFPVATSSGATIVIDLYLVQFNHSAKSGGTYANTLVMVSSPGITSKLTCSGRWSYTTSEDNYAATGAPTAITDLRFSYSSYSSSNSLIKIPDQAAFTYTSIYGTNRVFTLGDCYFDENMLMPINIYFWASSS